MNNISLRDFQPINKWTPAVDGPEWKNGKPKFLIDETTKSDLNVFC